MIEEQGRVLSVEHGAVWVETVRRSTCGSCQARAGCGQALLQKLGSGARRGFVRALCDGSPRVGDQVLIGVPEDALVKSSLWVYAVPLAGLFILALLAQALGWQEPAIIAAAVTGLVLGLLLVRWHDRRSRHDPALQPRVLRVLGSLPSGVVKGLGEQGA